MIDLATFPWSLLLLISASLLGIFIMIPLGISKYPSARALGRLVGGLIGFLFSLFLVSRTLLFLPYAGFPWLFLVLLSFLLRGYIQAFFTEQVRLHSSHLLVFLLALAPIGLLQFEWKVITEQTLILQILAGTISLTYLLSGLIIAKRQGQKRGLHWFQNPGSRVIWFRNFVGLLATFILLSILAFGELEVLVFTIFTVILLGYLFQQIITESTFLSPLPLGKKYQKSNLTPHQKSAILKRLDQLITGDKFYLDSEVSLAALAKSLHTTTHHLSQVLNESKGISFQELISHCRVNEAKVILKDSIHDQTKIENVAAMVGYNSKSAFNTAFKKFTNLTPTEYREAKGVLTYREERLPERKRRFHIASALSSYHDSFFNLRLDMVSNFLKVFFRSIFRSKIYSAINLIGLVIAFSSSLLIYLYLSDQLTYDQEITDHDQIYRIVWNSGNPQTRTPHPMAQSMVSDFPEVTAATSLSPWYGAGLSKQTIRVKNVKTNVLFEEPDFYFADSTFLEVFDLEVVAGDKNALRKPWNIVISEELALKYFGSENPIGQELSVNDMPVEVAAVLKGMPEKSHFHFNAILSYVTLKAINPEDNWMTWADFGHFNYIKTTPQTNYKQLESRIPGWVAGYLNWDKEKTLALAETSEYFVLQPLTAIHLNSNLRWELEQNGNMTSIYILRATMLFLLLIGAINYINLTTAKSTERAKEIGIRKTIGAYSGNLAIQFYLEALIFCGLALVISFGLASLLLEPFNQLVGTSFMFSELYSFDLVVKALGACLIIGILAGAYPAATLSAFKPSQVLKGSFSSSSKGVRLRGVLVVTQFAISAILIIASVIVLNQLNYMKTKELGFDKEAVVSIRVYPSVELGGIDINKVNRLKTELTKIAGVQHVASASNLPGSQFDQNRFSLADNPSETVDVSELYVDFEAMDALGFEVITGRGFDSSYASDSAGTNFIINEVAARQLGAELGDKVIWERNDQTPGTIIGIVKDFHFQSLHQEIRPLLLLADPYFINHLIVKMDGQKFQETLSQMEDVYTSVESDIAFNYKFLDQEMEAMYDSEVRTLNVFSIFSGLALFLACLGLLSMVMTILTQRVKEVGVRKILGATNIQIAQMVLAQFVKLVAIALIIGLPIGYLLMQRWMAEFSYQAPFNLLALTGVILVVIGVALLSVSLVVIRIANINPVEALKYE